MAKLVVVSESDDREYELREFTSIGRHPNSRIQLDDRIVKDAHAQIARDRSGNYIFKDLAAVGVTSINGEQAVVQALRNGDEIIIGTTKLVFVRSGDTGRVVTADVELEEGDTGRIVVSTGGLEGEDTAVGPTPAATEPTPASEHTDNRGSKGDWPYRNLLADLMGLLAGATDLDEVAPRGLEMALELTGADRAKLVTFDNVGQALVRHSLSRVPERFCDGLPHSILAEARRSLQPVLSADACADGRFAGDHSVTLQGIRASLTVPLLHQKEPVGVLHLDSLIASDVFIGTDATVMCAVANLLAKLLVG